MLLEMRWEIAKDEPDRFLAQDDRGLEADELGRAKQSPKTGRWNAERPRVR